MFSPATPRMLEAVLSAPRFRGALFDVEVFPFEGRAIALVRGDRESIAEHSETVTAAICYTAPFPVSVRFMANGALAA
jgi:hypothetical protein